MKKLKGVESVAFEELFEGNSTRGDLIVTFLAILEMVRLSVMRVHQAEPGTNIRLFPVVDLGEREGVDLIKDDYV